MLSVRLVFGWVCSVLSALFLIQIGKLENGWPCGGKLENPAWGARVVEISKLVATQSIRRLSISE